MARKQAHKPFKYAFTCDCGEAEDGFAYEMPYGRAEQFERRHISHRYSIFCEARDCILWRGHEGTHEIDRWAAKA